jgi:hypothetical protein
MTKGRKAVAAAALVLSICAPAITRADIVINAVESRSPGRECDA